MVTLIAGCLIGVARLKGVGLYLSNDLRLTLKYIYILIPLTPETKNTWYPEQDYSNMGIGGKITGVYWNRELLLEKRCQIKSLWYETIKKPIYICSLLKVLLYFCFVRKQ